MNMGEEMRRKLWFKRLKGGGKRLEGQKFIHIECRHHFYWASPSSHGISHSPPPLQPRASRTEVGVRGPEDGPSSLDGNDQDGGEGEGEEEDEEEEEELGGDECVISDEDSDTDWELGGTEEVDFQIEKDKLEWVRY